MQLKPESRFSHHHFPHSKVYHALLVTGLLTLPALAQAENAADEKIVVTATQTKHTTLSAPASVSVITRAELEKMSVNNVTDVVKKLPGININPSTSYGRNEIKIRGMKADYTLLLINGRRVNSRDALAGNMGNDFDLSAIPISAIDRVEVIRGPMSSLYGADALGGVVNVILKQPGNDLKGEIGYNFEAPTEGSGGDHNRLNGYISGPLIENMLLGSLLADGGKRDAWKTEQSINQNTDALEKRDNYNVIGNLTWLLDSQQSLDFDVTYTKDDRDVHWNNYGTAVRNIQKMERLGLGLMHNGSWDNADTRLRYFYENVELMDNSQLNNGKADITQDNHTVDGQVSGYLGDHLLTGGGEYRLTSLKHSMNLPNGTIDVSQGALFLQDEFKLADLALTFGGRVDKHETYGTEFSPRAYATYSLTDNWVIKGGVSKAFKAPSIAQSSESYAIAACRGRCQTVGNPDLKPETSISYEIGTAYEAERFGAGVTLFNNDIKDMIQVQTWDRVATRLTYENVNKARIQGIETSFWVDVTDDLNWTTNWTIVDAEDRTTRMRLKQTPKNTVNTQLNWQALDNLSTYISYQYTGNQYLFDKEVSKTRGFNTVDIGATYTPIKNVDLKLGLTNLTNEKRDYVATNNDYFLSGRTVYGGVSYKF
ncbi:TonB-dependent receptor domain-containing protein [Pectobacterium carotovorum]|uniref:TonB-dependent receptor n=1 Tax=Pectobacterium carotovorum subsp. carotovorum TaxID=555 RepID=A0AAI9L1E5_PECCC|nr:TonB-dependent receptor [Pectobacterium carotovorum]GKX46848.1 TonB-dependent receptor [Pectobacterium carotovorum subsp. carotovorum]GLV69294.1 TonB-dependent receptor [Pectobacterium carotovorum subsp. carotovorum]